MDVGHSCLIMKSYEAGSSKDYSAGTVAAVLFEQKHRVEGKRMQSVQVRESSLSLFLSVCLSAHVSRLTVVVRLGTLGSLEELLYHCRNDMIETDRVI